MITQQDADKILKRFIPQLKLKEWEILMYVLPVDVYQGTHGKDFSFETHGCTEIDELCEKAVVFIRDDLSKEQLVDTIRHELCHLVTHKYDSYVRKVATHVDSKKLKKVLEEEGMWEMEINVSKLANILKGLGVS